MERILERMNILILSFLLGMSCQSQDTNESASSPEAASPSSGARSEPGPVLSTAESLLLREALALGIHRQPQHLRSLTEALLSQEVFLKLPREFPRGELVEYFERHPEEFSVPEAVAASWIKIPSDREGGAALAEDLRTRIVGQPSLFGPLAKEFSADQGSAHRGGSVGVQRRSSSSLPGPVLDQIFALSAGELSPVFRTSDAWNLVSVSWRRPKEERTFEQMQSAVADVLRQQRYVAERERYLEALRAKYLLAPAD
jgi:hypothetical protein